jgi:hypothetical protein
VNKGLPPLIVHEKKTLNSLFQEFNIIDFMEKMEIMKTLRLKSGVYHNSQDIYGNHDMNNNFYHCEKITKFHASHTLVEHMREKITFLRAYTTLQ